MSRDAVLVEGTLDAIAIHLADVERRYAPVAPSGTALTAAQVTAFAGAVDLSDRSVIVAFDGDPAGQHAATRAHKLRREHTDDLQHAQLAAEIDPARLLEDQGAHAVLNAPADRSPPPCSANTWPPPATSPPGIAANRPRT